MNNEYYLGLDVGTNSVGWCLTNQHYDVVRVKGKHLWGVRLFEESKSAKDRRGFRSQRRRLQRRKNRINLLREIFASEINKVDPTFFQRLDESFFDYDDRTNKNKTTLFIDKNFTDKDFFAKFPTIYHLRKYLMESTKKEDIRFIYLALSNIVKNRGHFLIEKFDVNNVLNKEEIELNLKEINEKFKKYNDYNDIEVKENIIDELKVVFSIKTKSDRKKQIGEIFENISNKALKDIISILLSGSEIKAKKYRNTF